jgi:guanylate kinase
MAEARSEMSHFAEYDYLVVNDVFEDALDDLACIVRAEGLTREQSQGRLGRVLSGLMPRDSRQRNA